MSDIIAASIDADLPVLLWGPPGIGKTAIVQSLARKRKARIETLIGSTLDPTDVGGYLIPGPDGVYSEPPPWVRRCAKSLADGVNTWLFLDEFSCAPSSVRAALLRLVHERQAGDVNLKGIRVIAASNPVDTAADGGEVDPATANRWVHVECSADAQQWIAGELSGWGNPSAPAPSKARESVCAWIARSPSALLGKPSERGYPTPRSWSQAIRLCEQMPSQSWTAGAGALVGPSAAAEWAEWRASSDLPDPEDVLSGKTPLPDRADRLSATLLSLVGTALSSHPERQARINRVGELLNGVREDQALLPARALARAEGVSLPKSVRELGLRMRSL